MYNHKQYEMNSRGPSDDLSEVRLTGFVQSGEDTPPTREKMNERLHDHTGGGVANSAFEMPPDDVPSNGLSCESLFYLI